MIIYIDPADAYHEGGHAAMFWHYGIPLEYVSIEPDLVHGYGGVTVTPPRPDITGHTALENEMRISAAGNAAKWHINRRPIPTGEYLTRNFDLAVTDLQTNPDPSIHHDLRDFAKMGLARDKEIREAGLNLETGPAGWVPVWLEAEDMIRAMLWPAVKAVADALIATTQPHQIDGATVAGLMSAAMTAAQPSPGPVHS